MDRKSSHSVTLDREKCKGCTTCIKQCPTQAIRVRRGKATIIREHCIDCGVCIRVCPHHAKKAVCDPFEMLEQFQYKVALPAPSLYGQFRNLDDVNIVLGGLLKLGFDAVYEVSRGAEMVSDYTRRRMKETTDYPVISSACPAVVRLICNRFPNLVDHIAPHAAPIDIAAVHAREEAVAATGLPPDQIGVFFITPCPAKVTAIRSPLGMEKSPLDGALSMSDVYVRLLSVMKPGEPAPQLAKSGIIGIGWATSGGEASSLLGEHYIAVDGIEDVIRVLSDIEDDKLPELHFVELNACTQGCVGGCLTVENPYVAKSRIKQLMKLLPVSRNKMAPGDDVPGRLLFQKKLQPENGRALDQDFARAMEKMQRIEELVKALPGLDCGSCGAPTCRALAEDVVQGHASEEDCIFRMRERMQYLSGTGDADAYLPAPFRQGEEKSN